MVRVEPVTSAANPLVKDVRRALARGGLTDEGYCVAEGFHLLDEALRSGLEVGAVLASESAIESVQGRFRGPINVRLAVLPDRLLQATAATETSQGVIALVHPPSWEVERLREGPQKGHGLVVILDGIQDPGNAGSIARSAEAFGATGMIFVKGSVGPFHPKTLRASAGSVFRVPLVTGLDPAAVLGALRGMPVHAAMPYTGSEHLAEDVDLRKPCAIVIGSEGRGVSAEFTRVADALAIPTVGVESLNAAVAAAVLLYEARRQRLGL